jgi:hypothetical protein
MFGLTHNVVFCFFHYDSIADTFELLKLDVGNTIKYIL